MKCALNLFSIVGTKSMSILKGHEIKFVFLEIKKHSLPDSVLFLGENYLFLVDCVVL